MKRVLEPRLLRVAEEIATPCHADIGTDHGLLPWYLLENGHCQKVIAIDISDKALERPRRLLSNYPAQVRLGDGFSCLKADEVDSVSLCGLGGSTIVEMLERYPERVPNKVVVQANRDSRKVRKWALEAGFHVQREQIVRGTWVYPILTFLKMEGPDPAYSGVPRELGVRFGPLFLKQRPPLFVEVLEERWKEFAGYPDTAERRLLEGAIRFISQS